MKLRPSSFPALNECSAYESSDVKMDNYAEAGTDRHAALWEFIAGKDGLLDLLPDDEQDGVRWAAEYIRLHAPMNDYPLVIEQQGSFESFECDDPIKGTPDCWCGPELFDFKWRYADYRLQMACYVRMRYEMGFDKEKPIRVHILFGADQKAHVSTWSYDESVLETDRVIIKVSQGGERKPNDFCTRCKHHLTCPAVLARVNAVVAGRPDWFLDQYHSSRIDTAPEMARALEIAWILEDWCKSVDFHAKELVQKQGTQLPGFTLKERAGKRVVTDVQRAFELIGLPAEKFLPCCTVGTTKLEEAYYGAGMAMTKKAAKMAVNSKLAPVIEQKPSTWNFVKEKQNNA